MVMQWAGADITQQQVATLAFSPGAGGTYLADMIGSSRRLGQLAVEIGDFDQLLTEVTAGHPVIVFQNLGLAVLPVWHYGVVTGSTSKPTCGVPSSMLRERASTERGTRR